MVKEKIVKKKSTTTRSSGLPAGWKRVKAQEDGHVSMWLESAKTGGVISVVPWGRDSFPDDRAIRVSTIGRRVEIPSHKSKIDHITPKGLYDIANRAYKRKYKEIL